MWKTTCVFVYLQSQTSGAPLRETSFRYRGVSSKEVLIFKENRLSLIDWYKVFVSACKISGDFYV